MKRRAILILIPIVLVMCVTGYGSFWWIVSGQIKDGIERWAVQRRAEGWSVAYDLPNAKGFPFWITLDFKQPRIEAPVRDGVVNWKGPALNLRMRPWQFGHIEFTATGTHHARHLHLPTKRLTNTQVKHGDGEIRLDPKGRIQHIVADLRSVLLRLPDQPGDIAVKQVRATVEPPKNGGPAPRSVTATISGIVLPPSIRTPLGQNIERVDLTAELEKQIGPGALPAALAAWRDAGGRLRLKDVGIKWGPLDLRADGGVVLDGQLQPKGKLTVRVRGYNQTISTLTRDGRLDPRRALATGLALGLLARPGPNGGPPQVTIPVTVENRFVTAGPQRLGRLPVIVWK